MFTVRLNQTKTISVADYAEACKKVMDHVNKKPKDIRFAGKIFDASGTLVAFVCNNSKVYAAWTDATQLFGFKLGDIVYDMYTHLRPQTAG